MPAAIGSEIVGKTYGRLTVVAISRIPKRGRSVLMFTCQCSCGVEKEIEASWVRSGNTSSCGCGKFVGLELIGKTFGRLTVIEVAGKGKNSRTLIKCKCSCGKEKVMESRHMLMGRSLSCGCLSVEMATARVYRHGHTVDSNPTPEYICWLAMRDRCNDPTNPMYYRYGGRGITVCERWSDFENFFSDLGKRPTGKSLDRIDNDGNYEPCNVKWSTPSEQASNRSTTVWIEIDGERKCLGAVAKERGVKDHIVRKRYKNGIRWEALFVK